MKHSILILLLLFLILLFFWGSSGHALRYHYEMKLDTNTCPICISKTDAEVNSDNEELDNDKDSWICCDICSQWFHPTCISLSPFDVNRICSFHCSSCETEHGPSELRRQLKRAKIHIDYVALNQGDLFAVNKSEHPHVRKLQSFEPSVDRKKQLYIEVLESEQLDVKHVLNSRLTKPILVPSVTEESGMKLPVTRDKLTVEYITQKTGGNETVEVMDVLSQQSESPSWTLEKWCQYFYTPADRRDRIRNVISLEVSQVEELGSSFIRPAMVREMDMVDLVWPLNELKDQVDTEERPKVTTYCLMSVKDSYTDFHIDFSGTPVYYTVCEGSKEFVMFPPTHLNLELYEQWCLEEEQNHIWFCDYEKRIDGKMCRATDGFKVHLQKGDLFIIPSGWIHSVFTPSDTVVVGGNYLTFMDIPMHIKIYDLERRTGVPSRYRFPKFNKVLWLASWYLLHNTNNFISQVEKPEVSIKTEQSGDSICVKQENLSGKDDLSIAKAASLDSNNSQDLKLECTRNILCSLIPHLRNHYELSKDSQIAKKSIPTKLIGRNVGLYLNKLQSFLDSL